jgi:hypothetical protein
MGQDQQITLGPLRLEDANDLIRSLSAIGVTGQREMPATTQYGDTSLVNVLLPFAPGVATAVLTVVVGLMMRGGSSKSSKTDYTFRSTKPDGTVTEITLQLSDKERSTKELSPESVKQLANLANLTADQIRAALPPVTPSAS